MISAVIVIVDKGSNCLFQFTGHLIRQLVDFPFESRMIPFNLAISLGMEESVSGSVFNPYQPLILIELLGYLDCPIIRQQHCPVL
jgi:hypothetical protein